MILQALAQLYERRNAPHADNASRLPTFGLEKAAIPFVIEITKDGTAVQIRDTRTLIGKRLIADQFLVPAGAERSSDVASSLLWENAEYALGITASNKPARVAKQHLAFRQRVQGLPENMRMDAGVLAVARFLERLDENLSTLRTKPGWEEIAATNPNLAFSLLGDSELICQRTAIVEAAASLVVSKGSTRGQCLVSGLEDDIARIHIKIGGVRDPGGQAVKPLVSVNDTELPALASYGKTAAFNSPVGVGAMFAYTTALNTLLDRDSRNRVQVGDAPTVFWADAPHPFDGEFTLADLFGEPENPDKARDAVRALIAAARSGTLPAEQADTRFFVLGLSPNAARISIRFWLPHLRFAELAPRLVQHFDDIRVARRFDSDPETPSLFRLLTSLALQGKADNIPPRLAGEWMRAILEGLPLPATWLSLAVQRDRASTAKERKEHPAYAYLRACVLKAWLNRRARATSSTSPTFKEALDMDNPAPAYRLGGLFATLERIQEQAQPGINATIRDRYYGAASTTPVAVFTTLLRLKNAHLKKLSDGFTAYFEKLIGEILAPLDPVNGFPRQLSLPEQGQFALGYYHQRQAFFTKKTDADTSTDHPREIETMSTPITGRLDFVLLFDLKDGNPNGDPDAGNMPRIDAETGHGLMTDVALKRKLRNFVQLVKGAQPPYDIYIKEKAVLEQTHIKATKAVGAEAELADDADAKGKKKRKGGAETAEKARAWICENFFDVRTFGAVMSLGVNCGQVRGPVQMTFARSADPIVASEHAITRMAVATQAEADKQEGDNRTMGRKHTVPYGLYRSHGFVSAFLAKQTGFSAEDLELLLQGLEQMFEHDRSAARGEMSTRGLFVFQHESELGNAHAHSLFDRISIKLKDGVTAPRSFADYEVSVDETGLPGGVKLLRRIG